MGPDGGSFSATNPSLVEAGAAVAGFRPAPSRGNERFPELVAAVFALERTIAPARPPSTCSDPGNASGSRWPAP